MGSIAKSRPAPVFAEALALLVFLCAAEPVQLAAALPYAHTQAATLINSNAAVLHGMGVANRQSSLAWFEWGPRGAATLATPAVNLGDAPVVSRVSAAIGGLTGEGIYECRLVVSNAAGVTRGASQWFATGARVLAWGRNESGQSSVPTNLTGVVALGTGLSHSLAVRADGPLSLWGFGAYGLGVAPAGSSNVVSAAAGYSHSVTLKADGTVVAWGSPFYGAANVPNGLSNVIAIAAGGNHSLALRSDGTVVQWGGGMTAIPAELADVVSIATGDYHALALKADGTLTAWGNNTSGQAEIPAGLSNVVAVASGGWHNLALKADGTLVAWGHNGYGQSTVPAGLTNVIAVTGGQRHSLALQADGTIVVWGDNEFGQTNAPVGVTNILALGAGGYHCLLLAPNQAPQAITQTSSGGANQDQIIILGGSDLNHDPLEFRITSLPASGMLYQCMGGERGPAITATDTVVTDIGRRVIFGPASDEYGEPYAAFEFSVNDGSLSSMASVTIRVVGRPYGFTQPAHILSATNARLNGMLVPNTFASLAWFEWGLRGTYSQSTLPVNVGAAIRPA
jgi:hypothetical protein